MNRRSYILTLSIAAVGILSVGVASAAATANDSPAESIENTSTLEHASPQFAAAGIVDYGVAALSEAQTHVDVIPNDRYDSSELSRNGLVEGSSRFIGADSGVRYFLAVDNAGQICLIAATDTMAGSGCFTLDRFAHGGANIRIDDGVTSVEAYAVNDFAAESELLKSTSIKAVGSNIFVLDANSTKEVRDGLGAPGSPLLLFPEIVNAKPGNESK